LIKDVSRFYHLQPSDLIYTGTPEGVGAVASGDRIGGRIEGVGEIVLHVGAAEVVPHELTLRFSSAGAWFAMLIADFPRPPQEE